MVLQSYGFMDITLEDENKNPLRLAEGKTATLTYPKDSHMLSTPQTIPLWYYDTQKGTWIEEGSASYDAASETYVGTVAHFTTWNLDSSRGSANVTICAEDKNGIPMDYISVELEAGDGSYHELLTDLETTDGEITLANAPADVQLYLYVGVGELGGIVDFKKFTLAEGENRKITECFVVDIDAKEYFAEVEGEVINEDATPAEEGTEVKMETGKSTEENEVGEVIEFDGEVKYAIVEKNGKFKLKLRRPDDNIVKVSIGSEGLNDGTDSPKRIKINNKILTTNDSLVFSRTFSLDSTSYSTNIGLIELRTTLLRGKVQREDGSANFSSSDVLLVGSEEIPLDNNGSFSLYLYQSLVPYRIDARVGGARYENLREVTANTSVINMEKEPIILDESKIVEIINY